MKLIVAVAVLLILPGALNAQNEPDTPQFAKYRVHESFHGPNAPVQLRGDAWTFRTRLRAAAKLPANFAGHYRLVDWGCGSGCVQIAVIDLKTGKAVFFPWALSWVDEAESGPHARLDSRAVRMVGALNEKDSADRWYEWTGTDFKLLSRKPAKLETDAP